MAQTPNQKQPFTDYRKRKLHFVFPKQSRLRDAFEPVAETAGFIISREKKRHAFGTCVDAHEKIPAFDTSVKKPDVMFRKLRENRADMALVGLDKYIEEQCRAGAHSDAVNTRIATTFNIASCAMHIAAAPDTTINRPQDLTGKRIATSYPYSLSAWLQSGGVRNFEIIECGGDTEDEIRDGSADAIFEIVDSGQSLIDNGLIQKLWAYDIRAALIERRGKWGHEQRLTAKAIQDRLSSVLHNAQNLNHPDTKTELDERGVTAPAFSGRQIA